MCRPTSNHHRIQSVMIATLCLLLNGCLPPPAEPVATTSDLRAELNLVSPRITFETMTRALASDNYKIRMACLTTEYRNREAGKIVLGLMDLALKTPVGGDKYLKLIKNHGVTQTVVNRAMSNFGSGLENKAKFEERVGAKIVDLPKFHLEVATLIPQPPLPSMEFTSANEENGRMIGRIKVDGKEAVMLFREVDGFWLIDGETE